MKTEKNSNVRKYKSKIGLPVYLTYVLFIGFYLIIWLVPPIVFEAIFALKIASTVILSLVLIFLTVAFCNTYYLITDNALIAVFGFVKRKIYFEQINEIKVVKSILNFNSFALSFNKIRIKTGTNHFSGIEVSPKEEQEFLDELIALVEDTVGK